MIVYQHRRLDTNEIFYIGIGKTEKRAYSKHNRNKHWKNIVNKVGHKVEIITTCDTREEACQIEQYLIKYYGRRDLGFGSLVNLTDGGEGVLGLTPMKGKKHSDETKSKISLAHKGRKHTEEARLNMSLAHKGKPSPRKGKKHSKEAKSKMSKTRKGMPSNNTVKVLDTQTGVYYNSIAEASFYYDIKRTTLWAMLRGRNPNNTNLIII